MPLSITLPDGYTYEGDFLVDVGMSGTLALNSNTARVLKQNKHLPYARRMTYTVGGVGGSRVDYVFKAQQVTIGDKAIKIDKQNDSFTAGIKTCRSFCNHH